MKAMRLVFFGLLICGGLFLALSCGDKGGDGKTRIPDNSADSLNCSASGDDEDSCDFAVCAAKDAESERLSTCADAGETACDDIESCYDDYASCHLEECPAGGKVAEADVEVLQKCVNSRNACLAGGSADDPVAVLDCEGMGQDPDTCNYTPCRMVKAGKDKQHDCEVADEDFCDDLYQCYVDYAACYNLACPPGVAKSDGSMEALRACESTSTTCRKDYDF